MKPWLTKIWLGRHWRYVHTKHKYRLLGKSRRWGIVSYKRGEDEGKYGDMRDSVSQGWLGP